MSNGGLVRSEGYMRQTSLVDAAAVAVLAICVYTFLLGNKVFQGHFENDALSWYFLAKGIFCSISLSLSVRMLDVLGRSQRE